MKRQKNKKKEEKNKKGFWEKFWGNSYADPSVFYALYLLIMSISLIVALFLDGYLKF